MGRPITEPRATVVMFPGQGALTDDARSFVAEHRPDLLELASELVGEDPFLRAGESTALAQPAIFCASIAAWGQATPAERPLALVGHSLGELSALAAAGIFAERDALRLVVLRGRLMAEAGARTGDGTMLALLGGTPEQAAAIAEEHGVTVANDNAPGQAVLSGGRDALREARRGARADGLKAIPLDVTGAFHSPAMAGAETAFRAAAADTRAYPAWIPVFSAAHVRFFRHVPTDLAAALTGPVRWRESMAALAALGADRFADTGPGDVLARLVGRNLPDAEVVALEELCGLPA